MGKQNAINKIIYFDKETIRNTLQERNKGTKQTQIDLSTSIEGDVEIDANAKIKLAVPFFQRLSFLISGELALKYAIRRDSTTTITSTEISEFEKLKPLLKHISKTQIYDIENSSTSFRVAGGYLKIVKGGVEGLDSKEFKAVMDIYDGYDTYKINEKEYVRFNNTAFVSNYKRNDLLVTQMDLYCVEIGEFDKRRFDFVDQISQMEQLLNGANEKNTLADIYPLKRTDNVMAEEKFEMKNNSEDTIKLYDVVYACVPLGEENG